VDENKKMAVSTHLRSLALSELIEFLKTLEAPKYRAMQIAEWLHKKHVMTLAEMKNLPKGLTEQLEQVGAVSTLELLEAPESKDGESVKYLMKTQDGQLLESVLIVQGGGKAKVATWQQLKSKSATVATKQRYTVCVSTQLGCKIGCTFCASGKGKFGRNLSAGEIVEQVSQITRHIGRPITNVVFMGMGEPLDNYDETMKALEILTAEWGFELGGRRITVSTSGLIPKIEPFVNDSKGRVRLSVSLHSSDQETRSKLVPINKKYTLEELVNTLGTVKQALKHDITFEYTLIKKVNNSPQEARGVAKIANRLGAKVNIIPYNPISEMDYERPNSREIEAFRSILEQKNVRVIVRQTAGRDIDAACGQLRLNRKLRDGSL
jgi:23S rRNA (adenine2503-C2)-methyltransferase